MTLTIVVIVSAVLIAALLIAVFGRRRPDDGVASFRRHIDALSPEARREVIERVQNARETGKGK